MMSSSGLLEESKISPSYLYSNSTSHKGPFSAIAELIDNAYDPDCNAASIHIDFVTINGHQCLVFTDNGSGVDYDTMHRMMSFGYSDKADVGDHKAVGRYGNGFKSGSMRLGKDALVLSRHDDVECVGLLSQTFLETIKATTVKVPMLTWDLPERKLEEDDMAVLKTILQHTPLNKASDIMQQMHDIGGLSEVGNGTRIIIFNLLRANGSLELDTETSEYDLQIQAFKGEDVADRNMKMAALRQRQTISSFKENPIRTSLREYCAVLYLKPRMKIFLRGKRVRTKFITKELRNTFYDSYLPIGLTRASTAKVTFGRAKKAGDPYGMMMYHNNRLIEGYVHIGGQKKANAEAVGVIGIIDCPFLQPTHNKQEFNGGHEYSKCMAALAKKLDDYWFSMNHRVLKDVYGNEEVIDMPLPDEAEDRSLRSSARWVQCENCGKWRKLIVPLTEEEEDDPWYCELNTDKEHAHCGDPEEEDEEEVASQPKRVKKPKGLSKAAQKKKKEEQKVAEMEEQKRLLEHSAQKLQQKEQQLRNKEEEIQRRQSASLDARRPSGLSAASVGSNLSVDSPDEQSAPPWISSRSNTGSENTVAPRDMAESDNEDSHTFATPGIMRAGEGETDDDSMLTCVWDDDLPGVGSSREDAKKDIKVECSEGSQQYGRSLSPEDGPATPDYNSGSADYTLRVDDFARQCTACRNWRMLEYPEFENDFNDGKWFCIQHPDDTIQCTLEKTVSDEKIANMPDDRKKPAAPLEDIKKDVQRAAALSVIDTDKNSRPKRVTRSSAASPESNEQDCASRKRRRYDSDDGCEQEEAVMPARKRAPIRRARRGSSTSHMSTSSSDESTTSPLPTSDVKRQAAELAKECTQLRAKLQDAQRQLEEKNIELELLQDQSGEMERLRSQITTLQAENRKLTADLRQAKGSTRQLAKKLPEKPKGGGGSGILNYLLGNNNP